MNSLPIIAVIFLLFFSCSGDVQSDNETHEISAKAKAIASAQIEEAEIIKADPEAEARSLKEFKKYQDSIAALPNKSVLDYYFLLPEMPYFNRALGLDDLEARRKGLTYQNVRNGYLTGGNYYGSSFDMALFRGKGVAKGRDFLLIYQFQQVGNQFPDFFHLIEFKDDTWKEVPSDLPSLDELDKYRENNLALFGEYEYVIPIIPEHGTTIKFAKCYIDGSQDWEDKDALEVLFTYLWNGQAFEKEVSPTDK